MLYVMLYARNASASEKLSLKQSQTGVNECPRLCKRVVNSTFHKDFYTLNVDWIHREQERRLMQQNKNGKERSEKQNEKKEQQQKDWHV